MEVLWHQLRRILVGVHCPYFGEFRRVISRFPRNMPHSLNPFDYLKRKVKRDCTVRLR